MYCLMIKFSIFFLRYFFVFPGVLKSCLNPLFTFFGGGDSMTNSMSELKNTSQIHSIGLHQTTVQFHFFQEASLWGYWILLLWFKVPSFQAFSIADILKVSFAFIPTISVASLWVWTSYFLEPIFFLSSFTLLFFWSTSFGNFLRICKDLVIWEYVTLLQNLINFTFIILILWDAYYFYSHVNKRQWQDIDF